MPMNFGFPINPTLTGIALAYSNPELIADRVLPRVPVDSPTFYYWSYPKGDMLTIPDTKVGRTSRPNQVEFSGTQVLGGVEDHALDVPVPNADVQAAQSQPASPTRYDPKDRATQIATNLLALDREQRCAGAVFNAANFSAANKVTLSGTAQWSDPASNPVAAMILARDTMMMAPTVLVLGQDVATQIQLNPNVISMFYKNTGTKGVVPLDFVANILGLREIIVGKAFANTAKPGQALTLTRLWGKFAALLCLDPLADTQYGTTFGYTAQWGSKIAGEIEDKNMGMRGGVNVRAGESVGELITAPDLGYLFSAAVA